MKNATVQRPLPSFDDNSITAQLESLDLHGRISLKSKDVVGFGSYSDVFKALYWDDEREIVNVAAKRIRLHVSTSDCKKVSAFHCDALKI